MFTCRVSSDLYIAVVTSTKVVKIIVINDTTFVDPRRPILTDGKYRNTVTVGQDRVL